jgi:hypothetical protein
MQGFFPFLPLLPLHPEAEREAVAAGAKKRIPSISISSYRIFYPGLLLLFLSVGQSFAQTSPTLRIPVKVISNYRDVLAWIPKATLPRKGTPLTQVQMDAVNDLFAKKLKAEPHAFKMRLAVSDVPTWGGQLQIYSEVPNSEGYHVRFFGAFPETKRPELAKVKVGDRVTLSGMIESITYLTLWNEFTLSIVVSPTELAK